MKCPNGPAGRATRTEVFASYPSFRIWTSSPHHLLLQPCPSLNNQVSIEKRDISVEPFMLKITKTQAKLTDSEDGG